MSHKKCSIYDCSSKNKRMFAFPNPEKDEERYKKWIMACGNPILKDVPHNKIVKRTICEDHFEDKYKLKKKLSYCAVLTLFLPRCIYEDTSNDSNTTMIAIQQDYNDNNTIKLQDDTYAIASTSKDDTTYEDRTGCNSRNETRNNVHEKRREENNYNKIREIG
ncbi:hypothetical protein DMN91_006121 [Ooceraea biroi]|uniref:THAP-type domain-containing protein n=2 Tax=Ooceraea biroi TaxID=2015173 RepID=A0A3L8DMR5_OOCBI|nr:hypothetical protein DMN91_006121 [Ooceraea biroi]